MELHRHLDEVGETYTEHLAHAGGYGLLMLAGGLACLVHALLPFLFERAASDCVHTLNRRLSARGRLPGLNSSLPTLGSGTDQVPLNAIEI